MGKLKAIIVAMGLALSVFAHADVAPVAPPENALLGVIPAQCPDGIVLRFGYGMEDGRVVEVFFREEHSLPLALKDGDKVYVYSDQKMYTLAEVVQKYPTLCELPKPNPA